MTQTTKSSADQFWKLLKSSSKEDRERFFEEQRTQGFTSQIEMAWRQAYGND